METLQNIVRELALNDRQAMVNLIIQLAGDEFETKKSCIDLAKKSRKQLRQVLVGIFDYYANEI
ncbi:MAG: hypothetical protein RL311_818 [Bacteroidota bacterium]|jgi:hypothetical protein